MRSFCNHSLTTASGSENQHIPMPKADQGNIRVQNSLNCDHWHAYVTSVKDTKFELRVIDFEPRQFRDYDIDKD